MNRREIILLEDDFIAEAFSSGDTSGSHVSHGAPLSS